jgi:hypothetical protein
MSIDRGEPRAPAREKRHASNTAGRRRASGEVYSIHWIRPNKRGRVFRFLVSNGAYTLVPKNVKDIPALLKAIREAHAVEPEDARDRLQELERRLTTVTL